MERHNKEVRAHDGIDSAAFLLRAKNPVGSWYKRARRTINLVSIDLKMALINCLDEDTRERIEIWATTS